MRRSTDHLWLSATLLVAALILLPDLDRGWFPHDEGVLGQSAERVLAGEVPHRDFDEIYTGLLTYAHAATFRLLGVKSDHLRYPLAVAGLIWLAVCYRILRRFILPLPAAAVTIVILLWSLPNYPAPMPSWYNLFLATAGVLALLRWAEDGRSRWLFIAGAIGGVSFLVKLSGVFYVAGAALGILAAEIATPSSQSASRAGVGLHITLWWVAVVLVTGLVLAIGAEPHSLARFVLPLAAILAGLLIATTGSGRDLGGPTLSRVLQVLLPFVVGALAPLLVGVVILIVAGGLEHAIDGVLVRPFRRTGFAAVSPPSPLLLFTALPLAWLLWPRSVSWRSSRRGFAILVGLALLLVLVVARDEPAMYRVVWGAAWSLPVIVGVLGGCLIARNPWRGTPRARLHLPILTVASFAILVEFPFAAPIYTLYGLPLAIIAVVALSEAKPNCRPAFGGLVVAFLVAFGWFHLRPGHPTNLGRMFLAAGDTVALELERAGLRVSGRDARIYRELIGLVDSLSAGRDLWAGPDAPQVYFYSRMRNTTRTMFDFLDREPVWGDSLLPELRRRGISVVVLNLSPGFSPGPSPMNVAALDVAYPNRRPISGWLVLWR